MVFSVVAMCSVLLYRTTPLACLPAEEKLLDKKRQSNDKMRSPRLAKCMLAGDLGDLCTDLDPDLRKFNHKELTHPRFFSQKTIAIRFAILDFFVQGLAHPHYKAS